MQYIGGFSTINLMFSLFSSSEGKGDFLLLNNVMSDWMLCSIKLTKHSRYNAHRVLFKQNHVSMAIWQ